MVLGLWIMMWTNRNPTFPNIKYSFSLQFSKFVKYLSFSFVHWKLYVYVTGLYSDMRSNKTVENSKEIQVYHILACHHNSSHMAVCHMSTLIRILCAYFCHSGELLLSRVWPQCINLHILR